MTNRTYTSIKNLTKHGIVDHLRGDHKDKIDDLEIPVNTKRSFEAWHEHSHLSECNHEHQR